MNRNKYHYRLRHRYVITAIVLACIFLLPGISASASGAWAASDGTLPIEIYLNGTRLISDVPPVLKDDRTFVPIRVIGEALGYYVDYIDGTGTVTMSHYESGSDIAMTVGEPFADVNGHIIDLPVPAFIDNGRTLAPVRFLSEALGSRVDWNPGYGYAPDTVNIYSPYPVKTSGGVVQIASRVESQSWELEGGTWGNVEIGYDLCAPIFTIPGFVKLSSTINKQIADRADRIIDEITSVYDEQSAFDNPDELELYGYADEFSYAVIEDDGHILTLHIEGYAYYGGAHGLPYILSYNIDYTHGKLLTLADIFKPEADYENILLRRMSEIRESMPEEYEDVTEPDYIEEGSFDIRDGVLILYYHPYALSSFARGFVEFRIPLNSLAEYINEDYLK